MTQTEYEQKRRECWEEFLQKHEISGADGVTADAFIMAFDRAYALGREKEPITQEEIEKAAKDYAYDVGDSDWERLRVQDAFVDGANFALGKQEKDADTVIQGWVARDVDGLLFFYSNKPKRYFIGEYSHWKGIVINSIPKQLFPDLTWESEPQECEIIIKRKKNG